MNEFVTKNKLDFEVAEPDFGRHLLFRVGTCEGQWGSLKDSYYILSVVNSNPGNGHLDDVFEWFEHSCKRDNKNLLVLEIMNGRFGTHLIKKRGFEPLDYGFVNMIKVFNKPAHEQLLKSGNEILQKGTLKCV